MEKNLTLARKMSLLAACVAAITLIATLDAAQLPPATGSETTHAYFQRGLKEMMAKNYQLAVNDFEQAITHDEVVHSKALLLEAVAQEKLKKPDSARKLFVESVGAGDPSSLDTMAAIEIYARFLEAQNEPNEAKGLWERADEIRRNQPPVPPVSRPAFRAGGDVKSPKKVKAPEPVGSEEAVAAGYSGLVRLSFVIGADGHTRDIHVTHALGLGLNQAAVDAVSQWTFEPGVKDGHDVDVRATAELIFRYQ